MILTVFACDDTRNLAQFSQIDEGCNRLCTKTAHHLKFNSYSNIADSSVADDRFEDGGCSTFTR